MLFLKKLGMSLVYVLVFVAGIAGYTLLLAPFNLTYLLKIPAEAETDFAWGFALLFACVVAVTTRTKWLYEENLFECVENEKWPALLWRILRSPDFRCELAVSAFWWVVLYGIILVREDVNLLKFLWKAPLLVMANTLTFGAIDAVLWFISYKRSRKQLKKHH